MCLHARIVKDLLADSVAHLLRALVRGDIVHHHRPAVAPHHATVSGDVAIPTEAAGEISRGAGAGVLDDPTQGAAVARHLDDAEEEELEGMVGDPARLVVAEEEEEEEEVDGAGAEATIAMVVETPTLVAAAEAGTVAAGDVDLAAELLP
jgi:hypothetical protein